MPAGSIVPHPRTPRPTAMTAAPDPQPAPQRMTAEEIARRANALRTELVKFISVHIADASEAEDVFQETCLTAARQADTFEWRGEAEFRGWLYQIARSRISDWMIHAHREKRNVGRREHLPVPDSGSDPLARFPSRRAETPSGALRLRDQLEWWLEQIATHLTEQQAMVLKALVMDGLTFEEVAEATGLTVVNVRQIKSRAISRLKTILSASVLFKK